MRFAVLLALALSANAQTGRVEGVVENSVDGTGIPHASLYLRASASRGPQYTASSDNEGRFVLDQIRPGTYVLTGAADGFLRANYGVRFIANGQPLRIDPGEPIRLTFALTPQASISGRLITGSSDTMLSEFEVEAFRWKWSDDAGRRLPARIARVRTGPDGRFHLPNLEPGRYYLSVQNAPSSATRITRGRPPLRIPVMYYPGRFEISEAAPIDLAAGVAATGVDVRLATEEQAARELVKIRGKVADNYSFRSLSLLTVELVDATSLRQTVLVDDGSFEFSATPGRYTIVARDNSPSGHLVGRLDISVGDHGMDNVRLFLRAGADIPCMIRREVPHSDVHDVAVSAAQNSAMKGLVTLRSAEGLPLNGVSGADVSGEPYLRDVAPGRYWVEVNQLPAGYYVKWIHFAGQDGTDQPIRVDTNAAVQPHLEILLANKTYEVSGTVVGAGSQVLPVAQVFLAPADASGRLNRLVRGTLANPDGTFHLGNVPPGDYLVLAFEDIAPNLGQDPGFRALFADSTTPVSVGAGPPRSIAVGAVSKDRALAAERSGKW
jgi:hypothetical protein